MVDTKIDQHFPGSHRAPCFTWAADTYTRESNKLECSKCLKSYKQSLCIAQGREREEITQGGGRQGLWGILCLSWAQGVTWIISFSPHGLMVS